MSTEGMYPALSDCGVNASGTVTLPDGRVLRIHLAGYVEGDTNAFNEESLCLECNGGELSVDEMNSEIIHGGRKYYLHEFAVEFAKWKY